MERVSKIYYYIIRGANIDDVSWSKLDSDNYDKTYNEIKQKIGFQNSFLWELEYWEEFARKIKPEKNSYAEYCDIRDTLDNVVEEIDKSTSEYW